MSTVGQWSCAILRDRPSVLTSMNLLLPVILECKAASLHVSKTEKRNAWFQWDDMRSWKNKQLHKFPKQRKTKTPCFRNAQSIFKDTVSLYIQVPLQITINSCNFCKCKNQSVPVSVGVYWILCEADWANWSYMAVGHLTATGKGHSKASKDRTDLEKIPTADPQILRLLAPDYFSVNRYTNLHYFRMYFIVAGQFLVQIIHFSYRSRPPH